MSHAKVPGAAVPMVKAMLWLVAAGIIGSIVYLSALDRARDFAHLTPTRIRGVPRA